MPGFDGFAGGNAKRRQALLESYASQADGIATLMESPIEAALYWALLRGGVGGEPPRFNWLAEEPRYSWFVVSGELSDLKVFPQAPAVIDGRSYRIDFHILVDVFRPGVDGVNPHMVVECDGHEFHERTKEQAARDRKRDRDFQRAGFTVLRFTGSEIARDVDGVVAEIQEMAQRLAQKSIDAHLSKSPLSGGNK